MRRRPGQPTRSSRPTSGPTGVVLQEPTLFPHLDLRDNVAFGPGAAAWPRTRPGRRPPPGWTHSASASRPAAGPGDVSGGQAQRAAIARTLAADPAVLLLDEPLAALDQDGRTLVRRLLRHRGAPGRPRHVLVSHDPVDALALTDRLVVLEDGRVSQVGTPAEITRRPGRPSWPAWSA